MLWLWRKPAAPLPFDPKPRHFVPCASGGAIKRKKKRSLRRQRAKIMELELLAVRVNIYEA